MNRIVNGVVVELTSEEEAEIRAEWAANEALIARNEYRLKRMQEYKSIGEQLDMLYWDKVNGTNLWLEHIEDVKSKYPKP